ncbi:MAG: hypothetical protein ABIY37_13580 [Devosia sp.]
MRSAYLAILPLLLTPPAFASEYSLSLIAKLIGGLSDGGETLQGALGKGTVEMTGEGAFDVTFSKGVAKFLYDQPDTCVFTQHSQMENEPTSDARLDFTKVESVDIRDQGKWEGLNAALITFTGPPEMLQVMLGDTLVNQVPAFAFLATSMAVEELQAAADELQRIC